MVDDRLLDDTNPTDQSWNNITAVMTLTVIGLAPLFAAFALQSNYITVLDHFPRNLWFLNPGFFLSVGDLFLPICLMVPAVAARRMGLGYGIGVMVGSWLLAGLLALLIEMFVGAGATDSFYPSWYSVWTTLAALMVGQLVAIFGSWRGGVTLPISSGLAAYFLLLLWREMSTKGTNWDLVGQFGAHFVLVLFAGLIVAPIYILARGR